MAMSWAVGAFTLVAIAYFVAEPNTRHAAWVFAPILGLIALVAFIGPLIWLWNIRKRESSG